MLGAEPDVGVGGEVEHDVAALHRRRQHRELENVTSNQVERLEGPGILQKPLLSGREVVVADDAVAVRKETIGQVAPDEARCTRHETTHRQLTLAPSCHIVSRAGCR